MVNTQSARRSKNDIEKVSQEIRFLAFRMLVRKDILGEGKLRTVVREKNFEKGKKCCL